MAGYRRFIAYVYDYENGKKGSNCGFIKVEVKDQQCSVEVHLHCPGLPADMICKVYGFTRKDGLINGILLEHCETEKEIIECLIVTNALNMNESGISLGKMGGIVITTDDDRFFGTEWDDQAIRPENFRELKTEPSSNAAASPAVDKISHTASSSAIDISAVDTSPASDTSADDASQASIAPANDTLHILSTAGEDILHTSTTTINDTSPISSAAINDSSHTSNAAVNDSSHTSNATVNNSSHISNATTNDASPAAGTPVRESLHTSDVFDSKTQEDMSDSNKTDTLAVQKSSLPPETSDSEAKSPDTSTNPKKSVKTAENSKKAAGRKKSSEFFPFSDGELAAAWKIHINDLKRFPRQYCSLRNNRFIQYGHYNFGHLLLGQKNNGQYILGVPGVYNQQERFMANMFGFPYFKESNYIEIPKARGGYWYRLIDAPDSHR